MSDQAVLKRLRKLSDDGTAMRGFRLLCAAAGMCSLCCKEYGPDGVCACIGVRPKATP